ncbi:MAG: Bacterial SH3 domain [Rhodobacteraceae bacterium HLUCCO07]|nr:MAG: Bacterial SH3 domain [Rhodobacteraceae bacterium HLUCCO07]
MYISMYTGRSVGVWTVKSGLWFGNWGFAAMWRFIMLTFGFLGWAFFELSGGAEYAPREGSLQAVRAEIRAKTEKQAQRAQLAREAARTVRNPPTGAGGETASDDDNAQVFLIGTAEPKAAPGDKRRHLTLSTRPDSTGRGVSRPVRSDNNRNVLTGNRTGIPPDLSPEEQAARAIDIVTGKARLADEAPGNRIEASESPDPATSRDIRVVSGARVNLRGGPGMQFGVVDSLPQGTRVEVLDDPGLGWVELQVNDSEVSGWMAERLLVATD